jgi:hypothetical protein
MLPSPIDIHLGAVWFRGYDLGDEDILNQVVRDSHFFCLVRNIKSG